MRSEGRRPRVAVVRHNSGGNKTMRFAARFIATMAVAFAMVPALYADDAAKPTAEATKDEPAASIIAPTVTAEAQPNTAETVPVQYSTSGQSQSGANPPPA